MRWCTFLSGRDFLLAHCIALYEKKPTVLPELFLCIFVCDNVDMMHLFVVTRRPTKKSHVHKNRLILRLSTLKRLLPHCLMLYLSFHMISFHIHEAMWDQQQDLYARKSPGKEIFIPEKKHKRDPTHTKKTVFTTVYVKEAPVGLRNVIREETYKANLQTPKVTCLYDCLPKRARCHMASCYMERGK